MEPARPAPDCYIGVDVGTSGCRAVAIDAAGRITAEARVDLPCSRYAYPGASEQDPEDWWKAVIEVLSALDAPQKGHIRALSVDATSSTLLLCDQRGDPCSPALMYDDRRALAEADEIARLAPFDSPARGATSALAKLLMLMRSAPREAAHALHQADWINGRLSGIFGIADENNVLKLGFDPVARRWPDWIATLGVPPELLPEVRPVGSPLGTIAQSLARRLGWPNDVRLLAGTTDSNAATLAAGIDRPGEAVTSLGSTLVVKLFSDRPIFAARYGVYSHRIGDHWLTGGASNSGGAVLRQYFSDSELEELSGHIDPGRPLDLHYYPLIVAGERFPESDPNKQPFLEPRPQARHAFLQAMLEGIADIEAAGYARLAELGAPFPQRVFSAGGGGANAAWRAIREHKLGVPVLTARHSESAYGAALIARGAFRSVATPS
ncbi:MAG: FGGY-family carbohydrate kinase [Sedimenticolaceae bacterium]